MREPGKRGAVMALATVVVSMALVVCTAYAADQVITGKKLLLKTGKVVLISKDPTIAITGSDPVGGADSSITFNDGSGPVSLALPKTLWSANGAGDLFKYKNSDAPGGPFVVKVAKVAGGRLKAVGKGAPIAVPAGTASINVVLSLDGGTNTYSMTFYGTGNGRTFLVKDAPACLSGGPLVGGFCWYLGTLGADCDTTCAGIGQVCDSATISFAGTGGTTAQCGAVLTALNPPFGFAGDVNFCGEGSGCAVAPVGVGGVRCVDAPTTCAAAGVLIERACACSAPS